MSYRKQNAKTEWPSLASLAWIDVQVFLDQEKARCYAKGWAKGWAKARDISKAKAKVMARAQADGRLDVVSKILEEYGGNPENYNVNLASALLKNDISVGVIAKLTTLTPEQIYKIDFKLRHPGTTELSD